MASTMGTARGTCSRDGYGTQVKPACAHNTEHMHHMQHAFGGDSLESARACLLYHSVCTCIYRLTTRCGRIVSDPCTQMHPATDICARQTSTSASIAHKTVSNEAGLECALLLPGSMWQ